MAISLEDSVFIAKANWQKAFPTRPNLLCDTTIGLNGDDQMSMTKDKQREIIDDFAEEIQGRKEEVRGESTQIPFRAGIKVGRNERVYKIPLELLRFRKENGRISSSVKTHELLVGPLKDTDDEAQDRIRRFLREKDPEKTDELKKQLRASGQREPGIITVDGFLINGNRRKVALDELRKQIPENDTFTTMKVVILPGKGDPGGAPTVKEIEQIENRYQLQAEGKAEYYAFDAALSIRDKESNGYTLEMQMKDDPQYQHLEGRDFNRAVAKRRKEMLDPLDCIDDYLDTIGRTGEYSAVSKGLSDREGRWQAFCDLAKSYYSKASTPMGRRSMGVDEDEAGKILQASYAIIRMRDVETFGKLHEIMRKLPKYCEHGKQHLLKIASDIKHDLPDKEKFDKNGEPLLRNEIESKWRSKYQNEIMRNLINAREAMDIGGEKNAPVKLLEEALQKLCHDNMIVENIEVPRLGEALKIAGQIKKRIGEINSAVYERKKSAKSHGMYTGV